MRASGALIIAIFLGACQMTGAPDASKTPFAPTGVAKRGYSEDQLVVGHRLMDAGQHELALKAYSRAALQHGMTAEILTSLGSANLALGRLGQSETLLRQAVDKDPDWPPAWNNLGVVLMEQGKHGEAMQIFRRAYALDSGESDEIRDNLRLAIAKFENPLYYEDNNNSEFALVRQGSSSYLLKSR